MDNFTLSREEYAEAFGGAAWESYYSDMENNNDDSELVAQRDMTLRVAEHLYLAFEVIAHKAEKRPVTITEHDYCPLAEEKRPA